MSRHQRRRFPVSPVAMLAALGGVAFASSSAAEPPPGKPSRAACVAAYQDGQVLSRRGALVAAREQLVVCAKSPCPAVLRPECVQWLDEVERRTPSVVVTARTSAGDDVAEGRLFVDEQLVATRLDGRALSIDPGEHLVRFEFEAGETRATFVAAEGEKGRLLPLTLTLPRAVPEEPASRSAPPATRAPRDVRHDDPGPSGRRLSTFAVVELGIAAAGFLTFGTFAALGEGKYAALERCRPRCASADVRDGRVLYAVGDAGLGVALVALGAATLTYLLSDPRPTAAPRRAAFEF